MNEIVFGKRFTKQISKYKDKKELKLIYQAINEFKYIELQDNGALPNCHKLKGNKKGLWDYHIKSDLVILFNFDAKSRRIELFSIGNHNNILD